MFYVKVCFRKQYLLLFNNLILRLVVFRVRRLMYDDYKKQRYWDLFVLNWR